MARSRKNARSYDVFLDGELIGTVQSSERRGEAPAAGFGGRIVRVTGWPTTWRFKDVGGHSRSFHDTHDQRNQAVYALAAFVLDARSR